MLSPRHFGRGRVSAAAVAAVVIVTPAAIAAVPDALSSFLAPAASGPATAKAPPRAAAGAPASGTPIKAGRLKLDLAAALGPAGRGIAAAPVDGAVQLEAGGIALNTREGGRIAHAGRKLLGGKVMLDGGIRLYRGDRSAVVVKDFAVDLRTRVVTATVGADGPDARLGVLHDARTRLVPPAASGDENIAIEGRLVLDMARIDAGLGADASDRAGNAGIGAAFEVDADLDVDLAYALGLDAELGLEPYKNQ